MTPARDGEPEARVLGWTRQEVARRIDHTLLGATARPDEVERLCAEAIEHGFASVCVNGVHVERCAGRLAGSPVRVASVVGFPLGASAPPAKREEARLALEDGAAELDMVLQIGALRAGEDALVADDVAGVVEVAHARAALVKVILETGTLTEEEIVRGCRLAESAAADFVKTSTGFGPRGASLEDVALLRASVSPRVGVKASGGIRTAAFARALLEAGATRLGTSASVALLASWDETAR